MWIERNLKSKLHQSALSRPVVLVTGARQTGKSSLLQREFSNAEYVTFDHLHNAKTAAESPAFFLSQLSTPERVIFDEIQYVPDLFRELKIVVDKNRENYGKWLLTGSRQFDLMENISESLAGRISILHLETLSASELRGSSINDKNGFIWKGGYPELWSNPNMDFQDFFESYIRTYVERDLRSIIDVRNLHDFQRFLRLLAARAGQLINYSDISGDTGVSDVTIRKWVHALQISGLIYLLPPFYANIGKRLIKSPKLFFADHGLLCFLLNIRSAEDWVKHINRGSIWENIVFMELVKTHNLRPGEKIFFYRDHNGVEIDFIVEQNDTLFLIEAKAAERIDSKKLNFKKVTAILSEKYKLKSFLLQNSPEPVISKSKDYYSINPLISDFNLFSDIFV